MRLGSIANVAHVTANNGATSPVDLSDDSNTVTDPLTATPSLAVVKSYTSAAPTKAGDVVAYRIVATNNGTMVLTAVSVTDLKIGTLSCSPTIAVPTLAPGSQIVCTGNYTVTPNDVSAGSVVNTATAAGTYNGSTPVNATSNTITLPLTAPSASPVASMSITKALNGAAPAKVGDMITYKITVTNTGDLTLSNVNVTDANATVGTCSVTLPATLATGSSITCLATHVVTDADMTAGKVDNVAAASSTTGSLNVNSNLVSLPLTPVAGVSITKALDGAAPAKAGDVITYKIVVTNTGNVSLTNATVTDNNATIGSCSPGNPTAALAPGATITCAATHVVTNADMAAGKVDNVANVTASSVSGPVGGNSGTGNSGGSTGSGSGSTGLSPIGATSNLVTVPLAAHPAISIVKKQVGSLPTDLGGFIHYTITVTNTGNIALHNVNVVDNNAGYLTCDNGNPATELLPGAYYTCSAKHALTAKDVEAGKVINVASVTTDENATADSSTSGNTGGSSSGSGSNGGSTAAAGTVANDSNEVITFIRIASIKNNPVKKPNGGIITLGAAALQNPKLKVLAFTGGEEQMPQDDSIPTILIALGLAAWFVRRRLAR